MINLKNLKSLFIVEESEGAEKTPEKKDPQPKTKEEGSETKDTQNGPAPLPEQAVVNKSKSDKKKNPNPDGEFDRRHYELLMRAIENNNIDGFDYLEFRSSLNALKNMPIDESTKFQTTFATASTLGLTYEKLLKSAQYYRTIIDKEREKFKMTLQEQVQQRVISKESDIERLNKEIQKKSEEIKRLTEAINEHQSELGKVRAYIDDISNKIEQTKNNFKTTYEHLLKQFDGDIEKISRYLGGK